MKRILFLVLLLLMTGLLGWIFDQGAATLPNSVANPLTHVYSAGIHPFAIHINLCGVLGLVLGFAILDKLMRK